MTSVTACPRKQASCQLQTIAIGYGCNEYGYSNEIRRCQECGLGITYPEITDLQSLYQNRTSNDFHTGDASLARRIKAWRGAVQARAWLKSLGITSGIVLDIGCGDGKFTASIAKELNGRAKVYGADFHESAPAAIEDCDVGYVPFSSISKMTNSCDLLIMRHSLEHTNEPLAMLVSLQALLREGGQIVIEVPNLRSPWGKIFGKHFHLWYIPYHRVHFDRKSLREMVERAGFRVKEERGSEEPSIGRSIQNLLDIKYNLLLFAWGAMLLPLQKLVSCIAREPAALMIVAVKPGRR